MNESRPTTIAPDPGMPSSHASSLTFLSLYLCLTWLPANDHMAPFLPHPEYLLASTCVIMGTAVVLTLARVISGHHTIPQVAVGAIYGGLSAYVWTERLAAPCVAKLITVRSEYGEEVWLATVMAGALFAPFVMGPVSKVWKNYYKRQRKDA